jgi:hypothetical protein
LYWLLKRALAVPLHSQSEKAELFSDDSFGSFSSKEKGQEKTFICLAVPYSLRVLCEKNCIGY